MSIARVMLMVGFVAWGGGRVEGHGLDGVGSGAERGLLIAAAQVNRGEGGGGGEGGVVGGGVMLGATTGEGRWRFEAVGGVLPVPESARSAVVGAHGTLVVDAVRDTVYWGLENVGWVAFSNRLTTSWVVAGDAMLSRGNLHGADLHPREGRLPLVVATDNVEGEVYLSDTSFMGVAKVGWPGVAPYQRREEFHPTDAAFLDLDRVVVTDGYGAGYLMTLDTQPLAYRGEFFGGKDMSQTPHGITRDAVDGALVMSARPEGELKWWVPNTKEWGKTMGLPVGSTVCDVDIAGDYALAPCLDGPEGSPGPIYVIDLRARAVVSVLRPKVDLGFSEAQHIHDAAWYEVREEGRTELYVIFTNWNPGGIGALRLVR